jgi:sulfite exporter TauE/SafE
MFYTALLLGFTGSLHCLAMCSPLSMIVSTLSGNQWINRIVYHAGRITTYAVLGAGAASINVFLPVASHQMIISFVIGLILICIALTGNSIHNIPFITKTVSKFTALLKKVFGRFLAKKNYGAKFLLGIINGFLPCGLSLMALSICMALPDAKHGFLYMIFFGVGTLPMMIGASVIFLPLMKKLKWSARGIMMILLFTSGILLIGRGFMEHHHDNQQGPLPKEIICD